MRRRIIVSINIRGYTLNKNPIYVGQDTIIIDAVRDMDKKNVAIKLLKNEYPSPDAIARFKHEYEVAKLCTDISDIVQVYSLEKSGAGYAIVMESITMPTLNEVLSQHKKIGIKDFLELAIVITEALSHVHQYGIIHKDINPFNIMCDFEKKRVKIIDFGLAATLPRELTQILSPNVLEGSLEYLSPEQTGRMNRGIDYRTDYYSLGVTFYQMITGQLPFFSKDAMDLVHCHIAVIPKSPCEIQSSIPEIVSQIIMKLLSKNAEDRYQNLNGLMTDLKKCQVQLSEHGKIEHFPLGASDLFNRFQIPEKMYGRENQIHALLNAYERVAQGSVELMLVTGYSGIGKSSLVHEVNKPIAKKHGHFISGKFDQFKRNIPYAAVIQALDGFVQQILTEPEEQVDMFRKKILAAVEDNGQVIIDIVPMLSSVIGEQPAVAELGPLETKNRFDYLFQKFIQCLAALEHPLVIFLDDLQWADLPSLKMLETLLTNNDCQCLFIIGAYRSNEVNSTHVLMMSLDEIKKQNVRVNFIELGPLTLEDTTELLIDTLHQGPSAVNPLALICFEKTAGNPFFLINLLITLYREHLIIFEEVTNKWIWDLKKIEFKNISDNVAELMISQLNMLPLNTQHTLQYAACIGNQFDLGLLISICKKEPSVVLGELQEVLRENYIICYGESYKTTQYHFAHDRIQQAAYSMIDNKNRQIINIELARLILNGTDKGQLNEVIFDIANHYNSAIELGMPDFIHAEEKNKIAEVNSWASKMAKKSGAFEQSMKYSEVAIQCSDKKSWDMDYDFLFDLYAEAAEIYFLNEKYDLIEKYIKICLENAKSAPDELRIVQIQVRSLSFQIKSKEVVDLVTKTFEHFNIWFPETPKDIHVLFAIIKTKLLLIGKGKSDLLNLPTMTDPIYIALIQIISLSFSTFYVVYPKAVPILLCIMIQLSLKYGNTKCSDFAYVGYGGFICGALGDNTGRFRFGELAIELLNKLNDTEMHTKVYMIYYTSIYYLKAPLRNVLLGLEKNFEYGLRNGDPEYSCLSLGSYGIHSLGSGVSLKDLISKISNYMSRIKNSKSMVNEFWVVTLVMQLKLLRSVAENKSILLIDDPDEEKTIAFYKANRGIIALFCLNYNKIVYCVMFDEVDERIFYLIEQCGLYLEGVYAGPLFPEYLMYKSLSLLFLYKLEDSWYKKMKIRRIIRALQKQKKKFKDFCPSNYLHQYLLVEAEYMYCIDGNYEKATILYDQAIHAARENELINDQAFSNELAAKFYVAQGNNKIASVYMEEARYCYRTWGADAKVAQLEKKYPDLLRKITSDVRGISGPAMHVSFSNQISSQGMSYDLDISTIFKSSKILSTILELKELLKLLMRIVIENAGAQKIYLLLPKDGKYYIEAEAHATTEQVSILHSIMVKNDIIPEAIINYIIRTKKYMVLDNASESAQFINDPYIIKYHPKSILCMPLLNHGVFSGILYMENNLSEGAFTIDRIKILNLLSSQIAISITNARLYNSARELNEKLTELNKSYERFVPRDFLSFLEKDSIVNVDIGDRVEKNMSVLFSNIKDFSIISANMTPQENFNFINEFLSLMGPIIRKYNGVVDKFMVDGIMALYPYDADDAVQCALDMQRTLLNYNASRSKEISPILIDIGIGINTGLLMLGTVGEVNRLNVTVISDAVNVAARVAHLTNKYKVGIIITEDTYKKIKNPTRYNIKMLDEQILVKGKTKGISIYAAGSLL